MWFFRESNGLECNLLLEAGRGIAAIEAKSSSTVSGDFFTPLHKVAEIVPSVISKTVVYGGLVRQERSDSAAVPLADLGGVIDRLDIDEELSDFISERQAAAPRQSDIEILDAVYHNHIRPVIDQLEEYVSRIGESLFRTHRRSHWITRGAANVNSSGLLSASSWESTKERHVLSPGFGLDDEMPLVLKTSFSLSNYAGIGIKDFSTAISFTWTLGARQVARCVQIDSMEIPEMAATILYADLDSRPVDIDRTVARAMKALRDRIAELSKT